MSSQEDIFATQIPKKKKKVEYEFVVLCDKDESTPEPFSLYPTSMFNNNEILPKWLDSVLDDSSRLKSINTLERLPGKQLSLFGKIERGIVHRRFKSI